MNYLKSYLASALILLTLIICFALPKPKYQGTLILRNLDIPARLDRWRSEDFAQNIAKTKDDRYNFLSDVFARIYGNREGQSLLLLVLDAGNFHHPRLCYGGSGFKSKDLTETEIQTRQHILKAKTFLAQKNNEAFVVIYWMCINKQQVDWAEQKFTQFWHSLFNKKQAGLMVRVDIPVVISNDEGDTMAKTNAALAIGQKFLHDLATEMSEEDATWMFGK